MQLITRDTRRNCVGIMKHPSLVHGDWIVISRMVQVSSCRRVNTQNIGLGCVGILVAANSGRNAFLFIHQSDAAEGKYFPHLHCCTDEFNVGDVICMCLSHFTFNTVIPIIYFVMTMLVFLCSINVFIPCYAWPSSCSLQWKLEGSGCDNWWLTRLALCRLSVVAKTST